MRFTNWVFSTARGLQVLVNAFLPFQFDVTSTSHVSGKFVHWQGFAVRFKECILGVLHGTSYAPNETFVRLSQDRFPRAFN